jgi:hypothetical protein
MRKPVLIVLLVLLSISHSAFPRPWENKTWVAKNPNIWTYGMEYWWNLPELDKTLDSMQAEAAGEYQLNGSTEDFVLEAISRTAEAEEKKMACTMVILASIGIFPVLPSNIFIEVFSSASACVSYKHSWKGAVDSALKAIEESEMAAAAQIYKARASYDQVLFMGLCDYNYSGPGSESCQEFASAFNAAENNITEGKYGAHAAFLEHSRTVRKELSSPEPDLSPFPTMIGLAWGESGTVRTFSGLNEKGKSAINKSEEEYRSLVLSVNAKNSRASEAIKGLENERLYLVTQAPSSYETRTTGSIKERMEELRKEKTVLENSFSEAKLVHGRTNIAGYQADTINRLYKVDSSYENLIKTASELGDDAEKAADQQRREAQELVSAAERESGGFGPEGIDLLREAKNYFEIAESAKTSGERFYFYSKAAASARSASVASDFEAELAEASSISELEDIIEMAEADGLDVAAEKETLLLIERIEPVKAESLARASIDSIVSKAKARYDDGLGSVRSRLLDKLSLAGPDAADLYTDLERYEDGLVIDKAIVYPDAIGSLGKLKANYQALESSLDQYMSDIVGNAMSIRADPLITGVRLDEPSEIVLDAVFANPRKYNASHVNVRIHLGSPHQFLYSDIISGRESIESLRAEDGGRTLALVFKEVAPYETKRAVFSRKSTIAHTVRHETSAEGLGDGKALVKEKIDFELESGIMRLELPEGMVEAHIDGYEHERPLEAGRHSLVSEYLVPDAYAESKENIKVYGIGISSKLEYDIRITPRMDLDSAPVLIDSINGTEISSIHVSAIGAAVKEKSQVSQTQYFARLSGLQKGKTAVVKVSVIVKDTESFVNEQLSLLGGANLTPDSRALVEEAQAQAMAGNHSKALELIEKSISLSEKEEKESVRMMEEQAGLMEEIKAEMEEIDSVSGRLPPGDPFAQKLSARKSELVRILADANSSDISQNIAELEKVDLGWLEGELKTLKKDAYAKYNDLKERFYLAGNTGTPPQFLAFEEALNRLESGNRLEYLVSALEAIAEAETVVVKAEETSAESKNALQSAFESLKSETLDVLELYSRQASSARGTGYSSMFTESEKKTERLIKDAENARDDRIKLEKMAELNSTRRNMEVTLDSLKSESATRLAALEALISQKKLEEAKKASMKGKIEGIRSMLSAGDYVNALRAGDSLAKDLDSEEDSDDSGLLILGITALALLAGLGFYMSRQQKPKKELRRLSTWKDSLLKGEAELSDLQSPQSQSPGRHRPQPQKEPGPR